jgi:hypothetical protein
VSPKQIPSEEPTKTSDRTLAFSLDDFGGDVPHRKGSCCPKCYDCAMHFDYFCQALDHLNTGIYSAHKVEIHIGRPDAVHSCGCAQCRKWMEINR